MSLVKFPNYDKVKEAALEYCRLTGLTYLANSGDGYLDVRGQRDIPASVWLTQLRTVTKQVWDVY